MEKAISALEDAIKVLDEATKEHKEGALLSLRGTASANAQHRAAEGAALARAAEMGDRFLEKGDAVFLRRLLTGDVPSQDWKKLNRKATFKHSYKARSTKIQSVLAKLLQTFEGNLKEADAKEAEAAGMYEKLSQAKGAELESSREALSKMDKEKGAKALSKEEAEEEMTALEQQVKNDEKYIQELKVAMEEKTAEWKERKALRANEIAAISKALAVLQSDDARDTFARSLNSQGYTLFQETQRSRGRGAAAAIQDAAFASGDRRLSALAATLAGGHFDKVIAAIDKMHAKLLAEEQSDLAKKEACEDDRAKDTRDAALTSRSMDEMSDEISSLVSTVAELAAEITKKQEQELASKQQLKEATANRKAEHEAFLVAERDDKDAVELIETSISILGDFYKDNGLMLAQQHAKAAQPVSSAGEAPPPPPPTWELPYGGNTEESTGILAVLEMIKEDIQKDLSEGRAEEAKSSKVYEQTKTALTEEIEGLTKDISSLKSTKGEKIEQIESTKGDRRMSKGELNAVMEKIEEAEPGCNFYTVNFPVRSYNRQLEMDGLTKAKAILQGAVFGTAPDEGRDLKPGDAFIQHARPHGVMP